MDLERRKDPTIEPVRVAAFLSLPSVEHLAEGIAVSVRAVVGGTEVTVRTKEARLRLLEALEKAGLTILDEKKSTDQEAY